MSVTFSGSEMRMALRTADEAFEMRMPILENEAILLDKTSEFNAKPELEIYADDVKCSHGSASGSLDENSIFYLMSRGLNYQQSKELLINGFLMDVVEKITDVEIKNLITNIIGLKQ